jgi:hypothetical protein
MDNFNFEAAKKVELPSCLQLIFSGNSPLLLDGSKKLYKIVSMDSHHKENADLVLNYPNVINFDM